MTFIKEREFSDEHLNNHLEIGAIEVMFDQIVADEQGREYRRVDVRVGDESDVDPDRRESFLQLGNKGNEILVANGFMQAPYVSAEGKLIIDPNNIIAIELYRENGQPTQMETEWAPQIMKATALEPLQLLERGGQYLPSGRLDDRTIERFTYMPDGIGLRSRQRIYTSLLLEEATISQELKLKVVSLGSGAAVPNIDATQRVERISKGIDWDFYDQDAMALQDAKIAIDANDFEYSSFNFGPVDTSGNFTGRDYYSARHLEKNSLDAVDALGLWEYLTKNQAVAFLRTNYANLKPGGSMIVSNMLKSRPHPRYNTHAVGWPGVRMRSPEDLLDIVEEAEIDTHNISMTFAHDGVYVVMEIKKL